MNDKLTVFLACTDRYDRLVEKFPPQLMEFSDADLAPIDRKAFLKNAELVRTVIRYFNLCQEEFWLHSHLELIEDEIWQQWLAQMRRTFATEPFSTVWSNVKNQYQAEFSRCIDG